MIHIASSLIPKLGYILNLYTLLVVQQYTAYPVTRSQPFYCLLSRTTWVGQHQKKHSPTHSLPDHQTSFINFLHLLRSTTSSLSNLHARQSFATTSLRVLFGLALGLEPSTSHSIHFFTQSLSSFRNARPHTIATCFALVPRLRHPVDFANMTTKLRKAAINRRQQQPVSMWRVRARSFSAHHPLVVVSAT